METKLLNEYGNAIPNSELSKIIDEFDKLTDKLSTLVEKEDCSPAEIRAISHLVSMINHPLLTSILKKQIKMRKEKSHQIIEKGLI